MNYEALIQSRSKTPPLILLIVAFLTSLFSQNLLAGSLTLAWNASTSSGVAGYIISYGSASKNYTTNIDVGNVTRYQVTGLPDGSTRYFGVKAYNSGRTAESAYSNEVSGVVPAASTPVVVNFTANQTSGAAPLNVNFTGTATATVTSWSWNFGDGTTGSGSAPAHQYTAAGTYTVSLTATGSFGSVTGTKTGFITVGAATAAPVANFSASAVSGVSPLTVNFTDTSTGSISSRTWNFGDGTTSTAANPSHVYAIGTYTVSLTVTGSGGSNTKTSSNLITVSTAPTSPPITPLASNLVAAYNFDEVGGSVVADASGKGNHGTINGATRSAGRFNNGLSFNGTNNFVLINDSDTLDLSTGYTLEAWVKPASIKSGNILTKEKSGGAVYNLYAYEDADLPVASFNDGAGYRVTNGPSQLPLNTWSHLVASYDRQTLRIYVNGVEVARRAYTSNIQTSTGALRIGGNSVWGEYFNGVIDEVKIYNRALNATEIQTDMNTAIASATPSAFIVGYQRIESTGSGYNQGVAAAVKATSSKAGVVTSVNFYLDQSSSATEMQVGIYSDNAGHPGTLLSQGKIISPRSGGANTVKVASVKLNSGATYWIAMLGTKGAVKYRARVGSNVAPVETSASTTLTSLPSQWTTGQVYPDGPVTINGFGY